ncbi:kazal-type proteinase inhibitor 1 (macronuclear) [Tetrahymena thermophila SB210]|uniref:Kazal-type proteinase inhibitor 1 n=1 Tax=Tetrahymena thermophila (strain SB210) TaxID=312017 RepID=I7LZF6_TETTS|nr:kazal-type proteinase inhibitor 1 [Tetrahymena thermophila SB210]EAR83793.2 kazal-type proteinase inhibitor 1 [Tetrahymena thermophila SB210]|eukprot:XP_001031456.2 kazal-type proteinase inhibitor 1 [Tetrahymena thermophila SB210]
MCKLKFILTLIQNTNKFNQFKQIINQKVLQNKSKKYYQIYLMNKFFIALTILGLCAAANFKCTTEMKANKFCTREYMPVCGIKMAEQGSSKYSSIKTTYGNKCTACAEEGVEFYAEGSCEEYPKNATFCHPEAHLSKICTRELFPTCGLFDSSIICAKGPCGSNFNNKCMACVNKQVSYFLAGYCDHKYKY